jgi:ubiquitin carboxyl-terminal hydrolase 4/11/15
MAENDVIVCYELPCHARTSRSYKKQPTDPFIIPVFLYDLTPSRTTFTSRSPSLFGYPTVVVVDRDQATNLESIYDAVVERLQRWTTNDRDLYTWEAGPVISSEDNTDQITASPSAIPTTEVEQNGDAVAVPDIATEEVGSTTEKDIVVQQHDVPMDVIPDQEPRKTGTKKGIFSLRLQTNHKEYGTAFGAYGSNSNRFLPWEVRQEDITQPVLLRENDGLFCEFDENMKAYYFGDEHSHWEHARWNTWEQFIHPEYVAAKQASADHKNKGISLQDCLDEFTKVRLVN